MEEYRLEAYMAVREMAGRYPDIVGAMRISLKRELDWTRCLDFLLSAAEELEKCLERGDDFKIDLVVRQFPETAKFFDEDMEGGIYTERRFIKFLIDFGLALGIIMKGKQGPDDLALVRRVLDELFRDRPTHPVLDSLREAFGRGELGRTDFDAFVAAARDEWCYCDEVLGNNERFDPMNVLKRNKRIEAIVERDLLEGRYSATRFEYLILEILFFIADMKERALRSKLNKEDTVMCEESCGNCGEEHGGMEKPHKDTGQKIDAREMTPMEAKFAEYCSDRFDEGAWLKKHGLISPEAETVNV